ncbi:MAG: LytR C-terminal domain-containing protein [Actinomycetota bacterium]|nr:LytR C-terminal domain-containing protein [Actinomycetota bacterium]
MSPSGHSEDGSFTREIGTQTGKAVVLIVVAVLVAVLLLHHRSGPTTTVTSKTAPTTAPAATAAPTTTTTVALIPPANIKLLVLNGTLKGVLAGQFTTKLKEMGYQTQTPDNTTKAVDSSTVYAVSSQYSAEAQFLAQQLGLAPGSVVTNVPNDAPISSSEKTIANVILVAGPDLVNKV